MQDFLTFGKMITPLIIQILFWVGAGLGVLSGLIMMIMGVVNINRGGAVMAFVGVLYVLLGPVFVRIYCEIIILFFRMNEALTEIKNNTSRRS